MLTEQNQPKAKRAPPDAHAQRVISDLSCYVIIIYKTWSPELEAAGRESLSTPSWLICSLPFPRKKESRSVVSDSFVTPWTVTHQAPLFMEFSRQEYQSGLPFPSPYVQVKSNQVPVHIKSTKQWKSTLLQYKIKIKSIKPPELGKGETRQWYLYELDMRYATILI